MSDNDPFDDGSSDDPYADGSSDDPYADGSSDDPYADGSSDDPYADGSSDDPYADGSSDDPYADGSSDDPYADGSSGDPSADSGSGDPSADSGSGDPYADSGNGDPSADDGSGDDGTYDLGSSGDDDPYADDGDDDPYDDAGGDPYAGAGGAPYDPDGPIPDGPIEVDMGNGQSIGLALDDGNDTVNVSLNLDLSAFDAFDDDFFSSVPLAADDATLFGPDPSATPLDGFMLETRAEFMNSFTAGNSIRRGELEAVEIGSTSTADTVSGTETATISGTLRDLTGRDLTQSARRMQTTIGGRMTVRSSYEDTILLGGTMTDTWVGATMIGAVMSDDLCGGVGARVTLPCDMWLNYLTGMEERPGTAAADGLFVEAYGTLFEREYGPSVYAVGTGTWNGTNFVTTKAGFRPLMRVALGVRNLIPGAGAAAGEPAPPTVPPAPGAGVAAGGAVAGGVVMAGAGLGRGVANAALSADSMVDMFRGAEAAADVAGMQNAADLRHAADTATQLDDLRTQAKFQLMEDWATTSDDLFMQASEMDELNPRRAAAMEDAAGQLDAAKAQSLRGEDPRPGLLAKAVELDELGYADEAALLRQAADDYGYFLDTGHSVRLMEDWATTSDDLFMQASEMDELNPRRAAAMEDAAGQLDAAKAQTLRGEDPRPGLLAKAAELEELGYADEAALLRQAADDYGHFLDTGLSLRPRVDIPDGSPGALDLSDDLGRVPLEENAEYLEMAAKWSDKVDNGPGGAVLPGIAKDYYDLLDSGSPVAKALTLEEYSCLVLYTGMHHDAINTALRATDAATADPTWLAIGQTASEGVAKLRDAGISYAGATYRGEKGSRLGAYVEGATVTDGGFRSTSTDYLVAFDYAQKRAEDSIGLQIVFSDTGVPLNSIAMNADESEILFKAGDEFTVLFRHTSPQTATDRSFTNLILADVNLPASHGTLGLADALTDLTPTARRAGDAGTSATDGLDLARHGSLDQLDFSGIRIRDPDVDDSRHLVRLNSEQVLGAGQDAAGAARRQSDAGSGAVDAARIDVDPGVGGTGSVAQPQIDAGGAQWDVGAETRIPDADTGEFRAEGNYADVPHRGDAVQDSAEVGTGTAQAVPPDTQAAIDAIPDANAEAMDQTDWKNWYVQAEGTGAGDSLDWLQMNEKLNQQYTEYRRGSNWRGTMVYGEAIDGMRSELVRALVEVGGYSDEAANAMPTAKAAYEALAAIVDQAGKADDWAKVRQVGAFLDGFDLRAQDTLTDLANRADELDGVKNYVDSWTPGSVHDMDHTIDRQKLAADLASRQDDAARRMQDAAMAGDTEAVARYNAEMTYYQQMTLALEQGRNPLVESGDQIAYLRSVGQHAQADAYLKFQSELVETMSDPSFHKTLDELGAHSYAPSGVMRPDLSAQSQPTHTITYVPGAADNIDMASFLRAEVDGPGGAAAQGDAGVPATAVDYDAGRDMVNGQTGSADYVRAPAEQPTWVDGSGLNSILKSTESETHHVTGFKDYIDERALVAHGGIPYEQLADAATSFEMQDALLKRDVLARVAAANDIWGTVPRVDARPLTEWSSRPQGIRSWKSPTQRAAKGVKFGDATAITFDVGGVAATMMDDVGDGGLMRHVEAPSGWAPTRQPGFGRTASSAGDFPFSVREQLVNSLMQGQRLDPTSLAALNTEFVAARTHRFSTAASSGDWLKMAMVLRNMDMTHPIHAAQATSFAASLDGKALGKLLDLFEASATLA